VESIRTFDNEVVEKMDNIAIALRILGSVVQPPEDISLVILPGDTCNIDLNGNVATRHPSMTVRGQKK